MTPGVLETYRCAGGPRRGNAKPALARYFGPIPARPGAEETRIHREADRPFQYLTTSMRKEDAARKLAERDGIEEGLDGASRPRDARSDPRRLLHGCGASNASRHSPFVEMPVAAMSLRTGAGWSVPRSLASTGASQGGAARLAQVASSLPSLSVAATVGRAGRVRTQRGSRGLRPARPCPRRPPPAPQPIPCRPVRARRGRSHRA